MRRTTWTGVALGCFLMLTVASAQAVPIIAQPSGLAAPETVVDFGANLFANFTTITNEFVGSGVTFDGARYFTTGTSNNLVGGFLTSPASTGPETLIIQLQTLISDVSFVYHNIIATASVTYTALLDSNPVESFSEISDQFQSNNFFGFTGIAFNALRIEYLTDYNLDTLAYNTSPAAVPEPSTLALLGIGLVGLGWMGRRRKKNL